MNTEAQDIEMLSRAILTEARDEAEQIKAEAREKAEAIRKRAREQAEQERKAILDRAREDAERLRGQAVATAHLKARSVQLTDREQLLDRVFKTVRERLAEVQNRPDYDQIAAQLLREPVFGAWRYVRSGPPSIQALLTAAAICSRVPPSNRVATAAVATRTRIT